MTAGVAPLVPQGNRRAVNLSVERRAEVMLNRVPVCRRHVTGPRQRVRGGIVPQGRVSHLAQRSGRLRPVHGRLVPAMGNV
jgi:hypothetical protein